VGVRVRSEHARGGAAARRLRSSARRFLRALGRSGHELSVLVAGDAAIRRINREWRSVDRSTDVLSFPAAVRVPGGGGTLLGDVAISLDTAARRARAGGRPVAVELDRYLAHGLLHLLGFDHQRPAQARRMAAAEDALLSGEGLVAGAAGARSPGSARPSGWRRPARPAAPSRPRGGRR
jgi:probable rRNA maturation factor